MFPGISSGILESHLESWNLKWNIGISNGISESQVESRDLKWNLSTSNGISQPQMESQYYKWNLKWIRDHRFNHNLYSFSSMKHVLYIYFGKYASMIPLPPTNSISFSVHYNGILSQKLDSASEN